MADLAEQEEALKVEKSCLPVKILAPLFKRFISIFFFTCQDLFLSIVRDPTLLIIEYL